MTGRRLRILATGPQATLQDGGRRGHMAVGVGRAGAADTAAYALGARLLGNSTRSAAIEVTFGGLHVRAEGEVLVCLTGAVGPATVDGVAVGYAAPFPLPDGAELVLGPPTAGLRTYLSVRGGLAVEPVLGSRSLDTMSGLGPPPLRAGDVLPIGRAPRRWPHVDLAPVAVPTTGAVVVRVSPGPRRDCFEDPAALATTPWTVSDRSDRRGVRLLGEPLVRRPEARNRELPSEGMVRGAIQVPPNGEPVIFLNDHPVTGGYPVIGVVESVDVDLVAQLVPGQPVTFRWVRALWS
jgi:biotin-dependent carboxylase-like uncharacterized protein